MTKEKQKAEKKRLSDSTSVEPKAEVCHSDFGEDDPPSIGDERHSQTLVAMGDDFPVEWADWLESLITEFADISIPCAEAGLSIRGMAFSSAQTAYVGFAEKIGVCIHRDFYEGDHTSGFFLTAWVNTTSIPELKKKGNRLIKDTIKLASAEAKKALRERAADADLETLLATLTRDPIRDEETIRSLSRKLAEVEAKLAETTARLAEASASFDAASLNQKLRQKKSESERRLCLDFVTRVIRGEAGIFTAGPFAAVDKRLIAITSVGGEHVPDSIFKDILELFQIMGIELEEITDKTVVFRFPFTGRPVPLHWPTDINCIWGLRAGVHTQRRFIGSSAETEELARRAHLAAICAE
jgi:hypothetical protein